jgi:hypothetical protein
MNNEFLECINNVKELKNFNVDNKNVKIIFGASNGIHGQIRIDDNKNFLPFAFEEKSNVISYLNSSFDYIDVSKDWIIENVESNLIKIVENLLMIDRIGGDITYINFATI